MITVRYCGLGRHHRHLYRSIKILFYKFANHNNCRRRRPRNMFNSSYRNLHDIQPIWAGFYFLDSVLTYLPIIEVGIHETDYKRVKRLVKIWQHNNNIRTDFFIIGNPAEIHVWHNIRWWCALCNVRITCARRGWTYRVTRYIAHGTTLDSVIIICSYSFNNDAQHMRNTHRLLVL